MNKLNMSLSFLPFGNGKSIKVTEHHTENPVVKGPLCFQDGYKIRCTLLVISDIPL